jgi:hypothetical protein
MMKTSDLRNTDERVPVRAVAPEVLLARFSPARGGGWDGSTRGTRSVTRQAGLVENDHVVQALTVNGPDHPFHKWALLRGDARGDKTRSIPMTFAF